jgi:hypothetical protein
MQEVEDSKEKHISLVWDFKGAHCIINVIEEDWGLQACATFAPGPHKPNEEAPLYLNTAGTFGISSAGYWWNRLGGMTSRGIHYASSYRYRGWILLFADDGKATFPMDYFSTAILILLAFLAAIKVPAKWPKAKGGWEFQWIGYWIDLSHFRIGISERRVAWVSQWIETILK